MSARSQPNEAHHRPGGYMYVLKPRSFYRRGGELVPIRKGHKNHNLIHPTDIDADMQAAVDRLHLNRKPFRHSDTDNHFLTTLQTGVQLFVPRLTL